MSFAISGKNGYVLGGAINYDVQGWGLDPSVNDFDSTTTANAGWDDWTPSTSNANGAFDFFYNPSKKPTAGGAALTPGQVLTLQLFIDEINYPAEVFTGSALIEKLSLKAKVKDGWVVTCTFKSKGPWTYPS